MKIISKNSIKDSANESWSSIDSESAILDKIFYSDFEKYIDLIKSPNSVKMIKDEINTKWFIDIHSFQKVLCSYFEWIFNNGNNAIRNLTNEEFINLASNLASFAWMYWLYWYESLFNYYATWKMEKKLSKNIMTMDEKVSYLEQWEYHCDVDVDFDWFNYWENQKFVHRIYIDNWNNTYQIPKGKLLKNPYMAHVFDDRNTQSIIENWLMCREYTKKKWFPYHSAWWRTRKEDFIYFCWFPCVYAWLPPTLAMDGHPQILVKFWSIEQESDYEESMYPWMINPQEILAIYLWSDLGIKEIFKILFSQTNIEEHKKIPIIWATYNKKETYLILPRVKPQVIIYDEKGRRKEVIDFYDFLRNYHKIEWTEKDIYDKYFWEYTLTHEKKETEEKYD
jgi:hypothetical protein